MGPVQTIDEEKLRFFTTPLVGKNDPAAENCQGRDPTIDKELGGNSSFFSVAAAGLSKDPPFGKGGKVYTELPLGEPRRAVLPREVYVERAIPPVF